MRSRYSDEKRKAPTLADNKILWSPSDKRVQNSAMYRFMKSQSCDSYAELQSWAINNSAAFWQAVCDFGEVRFTKEASVVVHQPGDMTTAEWFKDAELSFPEHVLRQTGSRPAIIFRGENGARRALSYDELRSQVASISAGLRDAGVVKGDRVAGFLPNCPEAIVAMLAATSIGAIWSSCSPDFGINGVVDRFGQIAPKVLFCADGYFYNGKRFDSLDAVGGVLKQISSIEKTVVVPFTSRRRGHWRAGQWCYVAGHHGAECVLELYADGIQSPPIHHVFVRNDRSPQVHRAWRGRHHDSTHQRTFIAL